MVKIPAFVTGTGMCLGARVLGLYFNIRLDDWLLCLALGLGSLSSWVVPAFLSG